MQKKEYNILVIIPARGGSKGIPRKNLRSLNGKPLISYAINTALKSKFLPDVFVSSDDDEILNIAKKIGAQIHKRKPEIADDKTTLDIVIYDAYKTIVKEHKINYDFVITLQPTSPLLKTISLDNAIQRMIDNPDLETVISAKDDTHLSWKKNNGKFVPNYKERVNRQYLEPLYRETGGFFISKSEIITPTNRIGKNVDLFILSNGEEIDIDTYQDWNICEYYLKRKTILFVLTGHNKVGLGHIYRALQVANDIVNHELIFLLDQKSKLGYDIIKRNNYSAIISDNLLETIRKIKPQIIINDILDTDTEYMQSIKNIAGKIINFEDLGPGAKFADIVINAMYPNTNIKNIYSGHKYFIARDEFLLTPHKIINNNVKNVLITFGGTDPNNLTLKTLDAIYDYCLANKIKINIVVGLGYKKIATLKEFKQAKIHKNVKNISDFMYKADIIFSSAGRTVYEIATIGTPAIILTQNERENKHFFATEKNGFVNLGLGKLLQTNHILKEFINLASDYNKRKISSEKMLSNKLKESRSNAITLIKNVIDEIN